MPRIIGTFLFTLGLLICSQVSSAQKLSLTEKEGLMTLLRNAKTDSDKVICLIALADYFIAKPGEKKADFDTANTYLRPALAMIRKKNQNYLSGIYSLSVSVYYREQGKRKEGEASARRAIMLFSSIKPSAKLAQSYMELSKYFTNDQNGIDQKTGSVSKAIEVLGKTREIEMQADYRCTLAELLSSQGEYQKSVGQLKSALTLYQKSGHIALQGVYDGLNDGYTNLSNYQEAIKFGLLALKTAEKVGDKSLQVCTINNHIGLTYFRMREAVKAKMYFNESLRIAERHRDISSIYILLSNICSVLGMEKRYTEEIMVLNRITKKYPPDSNYFGNINIPANYCNAFSELKKFQMAAPYASYLEKVAADRNSNPFIVQSSQTVLIRFYIATKNYAFAKQHLAAYKKNFFNVGLKNRMLYETYSFMLDTSRHLFQSATAHLLKQQSYRDSMLDVTKIREIKNLEIGYKSEKQAAELQLKDQHILGLNQSAKLQQANLAKARLEQHVTLAIIGLICLSSILLYRHYLLKQRTAKLIEKKNSLLEQLLSEKEWLLKEVHHRVKNNLHTIISLLESQAAYLSDDALLAVETSQHRIYAMSLIHQKLYQSESVQSIDMQEYISTFTRYLKDSFDTGTIDFKVNVQSIFLDVFYAVPIGIILNESVTNAIKYAFPNTEQGIITIIMNQSDERVLLEITDNGIGLPPELDLVSPETLGLRLMKGLSADIDAILSVSSLSGTTITVNFSLTETETNTSIHQSEAQKI